MNSLYSFGGAGSDYVDGSLNQNHASDIFTRYYMGEEYACSKGSYRKDGECVRCPRG